MVVQHFADLSECLGSLAAIDERMHTFHLFAYRRDRPLRGLCEKK